MEHLRLVLINILSAVAAFLAPLHDFMTAVVILFVVNFFCGLLADNVHGTGWNTKKAMAFMGHCFLYFGLITFVYTCGHFMHNKEGAVQCVSYICYVAFYLYTVNILRNLTAMVNEKSEMHALLSFLYHCVSLRFVNQIPYFKEWKEQQKEK